MAYIGASPTAVPLTGADIENGTIQIADLSTTGTASASTYLRGDGAWGAIASGDNTPSFFAYLNTTQSLSDITDTKIQFNTEVFDTDSAYDNSTNYRFTVPSGEDGKYYFTFGWQVFHSPGGMGKFHTSFRKNGTSVSKRKEEASLNNWQYSTEIVSTVLNLSASDYIECYLYIDNANNDSMTIQGNSTPEFVTWFSGFKLNGV